MARYFKEQDIDEFRECFYLFARSGQITSLDELTVVMRSLGMSPTIQELAGYLKGKGGKMSFADFLEVMHIHSRAENLPSEVCQGVSQAIVNGRPLFVVKVERHIIEPSGFIHQTLTVLTLRGYIVSHEWADNSYVLHLNPLLGIVPDKDEIEPHAPLREKWREDLQLLSDYLDFKSTRSSEGGRYVAESGALTGTVRDYLQALLLLRPHDALHFTRHYFGAALSALDLPHDEYFDPSSKHVRYYFFEE